MGTANDPPGRTARLNRSLGALRELMHREGRFSDANEKLDEIVKLVATFTAASRGLVPSLASLPDDGPGSEIRRLQECFVAAAASPLFRTADGSPIFGADPRLLLDERDGAVASGLLSLVGAMVGDGGSSTQGDDPLNEAFGHFVRDNFRGHIEDAQYLTPKEVVRACARMAATALLREQASRTEPVVVADPCCGVGSFLTFFAREVGSDLDVQGCPPLLLGQDKVDRMVRLAVVNAALHGSLRHEIHWGNTLQPGSGIDAWAGKVDVILTNPPFGARFSRAHVASAGAGFFPLLAGYPGAAARVSELLVIDRSLALLRDGGHLFIVVPDGVVSARGAAAALRHALAGVARIRQVIALPKVTFAQAGTRTRTVILHLQKTRRGPTEGDGVYIAEARELGFRVATRKGATVKTLDGRDELIDVVETWRSISDEAGSGLVLHGDDPPRVTVPLSTFLAGPWTPSHYSPARLRVVEGLRTRTDRDVAPLEELADLCSSSRGSVLLAEGGRFLSVLHVIGDGLLDIEGLMTHRPVSRGLPVSQGEVLISKINPRIPRVMVVPETGAPLLCSSEFEILVPRAGMSPYALAWLLLSAPVQTQIRNLGSGTSASHNRVKAASLRRVLLPVPREGDQGLAGFRRIIDEYERTVKSLFRSAWRLAELRREGNGLLTR